ncbi:MAG: hypothetical protein AB7U46_08315 [Paenirhodobacter sp.]|uniref:hypothetical protein n=1 Tax=Paenirhodobacter sp. TaxID=1965326 RepID=UPI003D128E41
MGYQATIDIPRRTWTMVTQSLVSALRIQNCGPYDVLVMATPDATAPTSEDIGSHGEMQLARGEGWGADRDLSELFPGAITTTAHLWVYSSAGAGVSVSHA